MRVTTTNDLPEARVVPVQFVVRGLSLQLHSVIGTIGGAIQSILDGDIPVNTRLTEWARPKAGPMMVAHARAMGAGEVLAMCHDANRIMDGITEVLPSALRHHGHNSGGMTC